MTYLLFLLYIPNALAHFLEENGHDQYYYLKLDVYQSYLSNKNYQI